MPRHELPEPGLGRKLFVAGVLLILAAMLYGCTVDFGDHPTILGQTQTQTGGASPSPSPTPTDCVGLDVTAVGINGNSTSVSVASANQAKITAAPVHGAIDIPARCLNSVTASWSVSPASVCTIVGTGDALSILVQGVGPGNCAIRATVNGVESGSFTLQVTP